MGEDLPAAVGDISSQASFPFQKSTICIVSADAFKEFNTFLDTTR